MEAFAENRLIAALRATENPAAQTLLDAPAHLDALWALCGHQSDLCVQVCILCGCASDAAAAQQWLRAFYERLSLLLFPEVDTDVTLSNEEMLYLLVLEVLLPHNTGEFDPLTDLIGLDAPLAAQTRVAAEYARFLRQWEKDHVMTLLRIGREIQPFDPASHTIGVHNVALHTAISAKRAGFAVDLPLIRAAALGHDIGKFGCRGSNAARVPYLHYY